MSIAPLIHPLVINQWIPQVCTDASFGVDKWLEDHEYDQRISGRVYPRRSAPRAEQNAENDDDVRELWPFVSYLVQDQIFDTVGQSPLLKSCTAVITFVMWWPALPDGGSLEDYCVAGQLALQSIFSGVPDSDAANGAIHACEIIGEVGPLTEGPEGFETCEAGYQVRIYAN